MAYQPGCQGRVMIGALPESVQRELVTIPGDWLDLILTRDNPL